MAANLPSLPQNFPWERWALCLSWLISASRPLRSWISSFFFLLVLNSSLQSLLMSPCPERPWAHDQLAVRSVAIGRRRLPLSSCSGRRRPAAVWRRRQSTEETADGGIAVRVLPCVGLFFKGELRFVIIILQSWRFTIGISLTCRAYMSEWHVGQDGKSPI